MLPEKAIIEFKEIYKRKFNVDLSMEEATRKAIEFFNLMKVLLKPAVAEKGQKN